MIAEIFNVPVPVASPSAIIAEVPIDTEAPTEVRDGSTAETLLQRDANS